MPPADRGGAGRLRGATSTWDTVAVPRGAGSASAGGAAGRAVSATDAAALAGRRVKPGLSAAGSLKPRTHLEARAAPGEKALGLERIRDAEAKYSALMQGEPAPRLTPAAAAQLAAARATASAGEGQVLHHAAAPGVHVIVQQPPGRIGVKVPTGLIAACGVAAVKDAPNNLREEFNRAVRQAGTGDPRTPHRGKFTRIFVGDTDLAALANADFHKLKLSALVNATGVAAAQRVSQLRAFELAAELFDIGAEAGIEHGRTLGHRGGGVPPIPPDWVQPRWAPWAQHVAARLREADVPAGTMPHALARVLPILFSSQLAKTPPPLPVVDSLFEAHNRVFDVIKFWDEVRAWTPSSGPPRRGSGAAAATPQPAARKKNASSSASSSHSANRKKKQTKPASPSPPSAATAAPAAAAAST